MSDYVGKHLLVDCYGCKKEILLSSAEILNTMSDSAVYLGLNVEDTYGPRSHICIHAYPDMGYVAIDIYSFDPELIPAKTMKAIRALLKPERIRATSVKRGDMSAITDMKPITESKTTALRKFRNTGNRINKAGKKVAHYIVQKREKRDGLGPE